MKKKKYDEDGMEMNGDGVSIKDFVCADKVMAFCSCYAPSASEGGVTEVFTDARLREFFKAYVMPIGDPLIIYIGLLKSQGFEMKVSLCGEPAIFAERKAL